MGNAWQLVLAALAGNATGTVINWVRARLTTRRDARLARVEAASHTADVVQILAPEEGTSDASEVYIVSVLGLELYIRLRDLDGVVYRHVAIYTAGLDPADLLEVEVDTIAVHQCGYAAVDRANGES